jgi:carboxypeptidase C (cathepsin A)
MRSFISNFILICALLSMALAQQTDSTKDQTNQKKPEAQAQKDKKAPDNAPKPPDATASPQPKPDAAKDSSSDKDKEEHYDMTEIAPVATHHQITLDGKVLKYTATAGRLPVKRDDGKIEAEMFFVAYALDGQEAGRRPLTFAFNGGPGSASVWLHMGALGPKRVVMLPNGFMPPPPYHLEDNPYTLLDKSDLVFVDAIGTGFSRAADAELSKKFWGVKGDIEGFSEFIRLYLSRYERWSSPLFLFGESYGTTRAAGVSGYLSDHGIAFNGVTLLSSVLNFQTLQDTKTNDLPYVLLIPSFTMIANYHHKLASELSADIGKARQESEKWASTEYAWGLAKGDALTPDERQKMIDQMARYTGLSKQLIDDANLRVDVGKFTHNLLLDQKLRVGRLDGRFTGTDPDGLLDTADYDPSESAIVPPYTSAFNNYVRTELNYQSDMPYQVFAQAAGFEEHWDWGSAANGFPDTATALREAMVKNPYLKVFVMEGYYDLATPYFAANYAMDHLDLGGKYRQNISFATYESGHMVYLDTESLMKMKNDEANFIQKAGAGQ